MPRPYHEVLYAILGERLKAARETVGLTQEEASERLPWDRSRGVIGRIESGQRPPDAFELLDLAALYDTDLETLLGPFSAVEQAKIETVVKRNPNRQYATEINL